MKCQSGLRAEACLSKFDNGSCTRIQFPCAVSHSVCPHTHTEAYCSLLRTATVVKDDDTYQSTITTPRTFAAPESIATAAAATEVDYC